MSPKTADAADGWVDLPPDGQDQIVSLAWDNGTTGNLTDRIYSEDGWKLSPKPI